MPEEFSSTHFAPSDNVYKHLRLRITLGLLVTGLLIGSISATILYRIQTEHLKTALLFETELQVSVLKTELERLKNLTAQITSRSRIRQELEKYQQGKIDLKSLVSFSSPKLADAMRTSPDMIGISRLSVEGKLLVQIGKSIPSSLWPKRFHAEKIQLGIPRKLNKQQLIVISAPIYNRKGVKVGIDIVAFKSQHIIDITQSCNKRCKGNVRLATVTETGVHYFFNSGNTVTSSLKAIIDKEVEEAFNEITEDVHIVGHSENINIM
ncbi:MAG: hypothetical protein HON94_14200, partial [Methylococcales bacterium]|nr:hypothetical protein [Methylococcales bacterium]